jgi:hypothetical protein
VEKLYDGYGEIFPFNKKVHNSNNMMHFQAITASITGIKNKGAGPNENF